MNCYLLLLLGVFAATSALQHIDPISKSSDMRLVVVSKGIAILPCDFREGTLSTIQYTWTKDNLPLDVTNNDRLEITDEGNLVLRDAKEEDNGVYVCKAENDNITTEVNVTLIVLVSDSAPHFSNFSQPNETIQRTVGSSVKFECPIEGHPTPAVTWLKDGMHMDTSNIDSTSTIMKWSITIKNLKPENSGNYTCFGANEFGSVNATFVLHVMSRNRTMLLNSTRPDLSVFHPLNTTVKYGSSATFQCRVRSEAPPNIQWLKKVEDRDLAKMKKENHDIIKVQNENYRILQSSEVVERSDGSFLNKLTIPEVYEADSGKYICLGANSMGYSFRSAYLTVLPRGPRSSPLSWNRSGTIHPGHPGSLLVAIPITLGVIVGVMVALVVLCHRRRLDTSIQLNASGYGKNYITAKCASTTTTTVLDNFREDKIDNGMLSSDEAEDYKDEATLLQQMQSEVELEDSGAVVTKICLEQNFSNNCESCLEMRNEV
ncbi:fibroblast growth factor receptor-like 1 [Parasteatoda tepidariorum]|uniref:fibroblast growth factor receptor-like 1 n=1 Tax=Parasteatoda tepidariorum TaxID=114398 RepID=UPI00077F8D77|nr:fibroblast growth factor receptor-like 1 [Parasteatoda tepidariorum]